MKGAEGMEVEVEVEVEVAVEVAVRTHRIRSLIMDMRIVGLGCLHFLTALVGAMCLGREMAVEKGR